MAKPRGDVRITALRERNGERITYRTSFRWRGSPGEIRDWIGVRCGWVVFPRGGFFSRAWGTRRAKALAAWKELLSQEGLRPDPGKEYEYQRKEHHFLRIFDAAILAGLAGDQSQLPQGWSSVTHQDLIPECERIHRIYEDAFHEILLEFFNFGLSRRT